MDIARKVWSTELCAAIHPRLVSMLPPIADAWTEVGKISSYHVARYGFSKVHACPPKAHACYNLFFFFHAAWFIANLRI
jgi:hypothetical protein